MASVTAELSIEITRLKAGLDAARNEIRNFRAAAQREGANMSEAVFGGMRGSGGITRGMQVQQASFQLQDFIVQVQGGQSALRAFIQQGSQFAGAFGPWGAVIGLAVAALGTLYGVLTATKGESKETEEALRTLGQAIDAVNRQLGDLAKADAARLLADHKEGIERISSEWENAIKSHAAYFEQIQKTADATRDMDVARTKVDEQRALAGAAPEDRAAISRQFEDRRRDIELAHGQASARRDQDVGAFNMQQARNGIDTLNATITEIIAKRNDAEATARKTPNATSDQEKVIMEYQAALRSGKAMSPDQVQDMHKAAREARKQLDAGKATFDNPEDGEKTEVARWKAERAAAEARIEQYNKELAALEKQRNAASETLNTEKAKLDTLKKQAEAKRLAIEAAEAESNNKLRDENDALRKATDGNDRKMMSPREHAQALRDDLAKAFGLGSVTSGGDVSAGLARLKQKADDARAKGDLEGERSALEQYKSAQEKASELAGLGGGGRKAAVAGETAGAISILLGGGGTDLVLDESKRQTQVLERISSALQSIDANTKHNNTGNGLDIFTF